jgi:formylglycine-generating enzyme required for sulfatase activity
MKWFDISLTVCLALAFITSAECAEESNTPKEMTLDLGDDVTMKFVLIPAGKFTMGSPDDEKGRKNDEGPQHDMHGNVWEWCRDKCSKYPEDGGSLVDPEDTSDSKLQAIRGGSWHNGFNWLRSAARCGWNGKNYRHYNYGFRVMVEIE